jgi:hypothetical protein
MHVHARTNTHTHTHTHSHACAESQHAHSSLAHATHAQNRTHTHAQTQAHLGICSRLLFPTAIASQPFPKMVVSVSTASGAPALHYKFCAVVLAQHQSGICSRLDHLPLKKKNNATLVAPRTNIVSSLQRRLQPTNIVSSLQRRLQPRLIVALCISSFPYSSASNSLR